MPSTHHHHRCELLALLVPSLLKNSKNASFTLHSPMYSSTETVKNSREKRMTSVFTFGGNGRTPAPM